MKKISIVHLRPFFNPETGYELMVLPEKMAKLGHKVYIIASNLNTPSRKMGKVKDRNKIIHYKMKGVEIYQLPTYFNYLDFVLVKGLKKLLKQIKPNIIQGYGSRSGITLQAVRYKKEIGYKFVIFEDQYGFAGSNTWDLGSLIAKYEYLLIRRWICKYVLNRCEQIYSSTDAGLGFIKKYHNIPKRIGYWDIVVFYIAIKTMKLFLKKHYKAFEDFDVGTFKETRKFYGGEEYKKL